MRIVWLVLIAALANAEPRFWGDLKSGPYAVGFRVDDRGDMRIATWFPAKPGGRAMTIGDYLQESTDLRGAVDGSPLRTLSVAMTGDESAITDQSILTAEMAARKGAHELGEKFPLVLWTPRYATVISQCVLSEFLASHGYVVKFARPAGGPPKLPFEMKSAEEKSAALAMQLRAMTAASRGAAKIAVIAWSYAGEAARLFQQREASVRMVIGLSTNLLSDGVYGAALEPAKLDVPYALIAESTKAKPPAIDQMPGESWYVQLAEMAHGSFNAIEGMLPAIVGATKSQPWAKPNRSGYEIVCKVVLRLLDDALYSARTRADALVGNPGVLRGVAGAVASHKPASRQPELPSSGFRTVEFASSDGLRVTADLYERAKSAPSVILFHQSGMSRGEYRWIAQRLVAMGFNALAVDTRWGGVQDRWTLTPNETAARFGTAKILEGEENRSARTKAILESTRDMNAAIDWMRSQGFSGPLTLWGSSVSSVLVFDVARSRPDVRGVVSYSPGFYPIAPEATLREWVAAVRQPVFVACGWEEEETSKPVADALKDHVYVKAGKGRHGSSILMEDDRNWLPLERFLKRVSRR